VHRRTRPRDLRPRPVGAPAAARRVDAPRPRAGHHLRARRAHLPRTAVLARGHVPGGGDAVGAGFVYNGKLLPALQGKYIFTDITTGRVWYADYKDMLAADDGKPQTLAQTHEVKILWNGKVYDTMFPIAQAAYQARGGKDPDLPGRGTVSGDGRADARFAIDNGGELYLYSKTDGMIRSVVGVNR